MPRSIKIFLWLALAYVVWSSFWNFEALLWPTPHGGDVLAKLTASDRTLVARGEFYAAVGRTICFVLPFAVFGILAGFFRRGWARWGVLLAFVAAETALLIVVGYDYLLRPASFPYALPLVQTWLQSYSVDAAHWARWVDRAMKVLLVTLLFLPTARPWFRTAPRST